jgi:anti-sigma B factor antagonist
MTWKEPPTRPVLEVRDAPLSGAPGISVAGEVDMATGPMLEESLDAAIRNSTGAFVIDVADVTFMDSAGINVLLRARALLGREDRDVLLICPPGGVLHALEVIRVAELFAVFATRSAAARRLVPAGAGQPEAPLTAPSPGPRTSGPR